MFAIEHSGTLAAGLALSSALATAGLTLNMTEHFGTLVNEGKVNSNDKRLSGSYSDAVFGMSITTIVMSAMYITLYIIGMNKFRDNANIGTKKTFWSVLLIVMIISIVCGSLNIHLIERFEEIKMDGGIEMSPNMEPGKNYKIRGRYGTAVMTVASITTGLAVFGIIQLLSGFVLSGEMNMLPLTTPIKNEHDDLVKIPEKKYDDIVQSSKSSKSSKREYDNRVKSPKSSKREYDNRVKSPKSSKRVTKMDTYDFF